MTTPDPNYLPFDADAARPDDLTRKRRNPRLAAPQAPMPQTLAAEPSAAPHAWPDLDPSAAPFLYIGQALTPAEFRQYCLDYNFGSSPPSYIVWHHTWNPDASWGPAGSSQSAWWDRNEGGMSVAQKKAKRKPQLDSIMVYYRDTRKWIVGPHLFIDDLFIWLFTPMYDIGIHANEGNSYHTSSGQLRYSVGIEVVGAYDAQPWPATLRAMCGWAAACLKARLNIQNVYTPSAQDQPWVHDPQLSGHRDYTTEKTCPGLKITNEFFVSAAADGWTAYQANTPPGAQPPASGAGLYRVQHTQAIFEAPDPAGRVALNGTAEIYHGDTIDIDEVKNGWAHLRSHVGFVPSGVLTRV